MSIVFETWIGIAFSMTPPWRVWPCGRTCFFSFCFTAIFFLRTGSEHLWRKRSNSQEVSIAQFTGYRAEDTCASRVIASSNDYCSVIVEANMRTIGAHILFCHAYYHRTHDLAFFHLST